MNPQPEYIQMETAEAMHEEIVSLRTQLAESKIDREMLAEAQRKLNAPNWVLVRRDRLDEMTSGSRCPFSAKYCDAFDSCELCKLDYLTTSDKEAEQ